MKNSCACTAHFQMENQTVMFANMRIYPRGSLCGSLRNKKEDILPSLIPICRTLLKPHGLSCRIFGRVKRSHAASLYGKGKWLQHLQIFIPIIWGLLIKIRACFLQMKRIGNISQRKFLWTILKRNARRTIILPVNIPGYCRNFGKPQSGLRQIWPTCTGMGQVSRLPMGTYRIWLATMCAVFRDDP